jgi:hypothetical protein
MRYVIGIASFIVALPIVMHLFASYAPQSYFDRLRRNSMGREIGGLFMFSIALLLGYIAFRIAS